MSRPAAASGGMTHDMSIGMTHTEQKQPHHRVNTVLLALVAGLTLASCGGSSSHATRAGRPASALGPAPAPAVVLQVGATPITGATYDHWMAIGAATVEMPKPSGPVPKPAAYEPPGFTACVAHLHTSTPKSTATAQLEARCKKTYEGIQSRILNFLITGYWLRGEAAEQHASVTEAEVHKKFEEEKRANYPTAASFRRLQETSRQTVPDLIFAVETRMLSTKLLEKFTKTHSHEKSEQATVAAFNTSLGSKWTAKTNCKPGYVVRDCKQYKP
jgi:hypothetical protein